MSKNLRRVTGVAVGGAASLAMVVAGGVSLAGPAHAAGASPTPPTVSLSAPSTIYNAGDNTPWQPLAVSIDNTAVGTQKTSNTLTISLAGLPSNVSCGNVSITPDATSPGNAPALQQNGCSWTATATVGAKAGGSVDGLYQVAINTESAQNPNGVTGSVSWSISDSVTYPNNPQPNPDNVNGNTAISSLVGQSAPKAVGSAPAATVYRAYDHQVIKPGVPHGNVVVTNVSKGTQVSADTCQPGQLGAGYDYCYKLNAGLEYNALTGHITRHTQLNYAPRLHPDTYRINVDNTQAGPPTSANSLGSATVTVTIPNLFSDVPATNAFAKAIYALGDDGILGGYSDGTFRPTTATSRQAFAHYLWTTFGGNDGTCSTNKASAFSDVPNTSQFCKSIRGLSQLGVINGYSDGTFKPANSVSRQAMAALVYRTYQYFQTGNSNAPDAACTMPSPFNDVNASNKFCGDIEFMKDMGLSNGYSDGGYHPTADSSRQAVAAFVYRMMSTVPSTWQW